MQSVLLAFNPLQLEIPIIVRDQANHNSVFSKLDSRGGVRSGWTVCTMSTAGVQDKYGRVPG